MKKPNDTNGALASEAPDLRALLRKAADQLQMHNEEYKHRTPTEFIAELRAAADGVLGTGSASGYTTTQHSNLSNQAHGYGVTGRLTEAEIHAHTWWCPHCKVNVPPEMVTKDGEHYLESGGCGRPVRADDDGVPMPPGDGDYYSEEAADIAESRARNAGVTGTRDQTFPQHTPMDRPE